MKRLVIASAVSLTLAFSTTQLAAQQSGQAGSSQTEKPPSKEPASIAGKWAMSVQTQNGNTDATLDIKVDGKKVTGTAGSPQGTIPINGEYADGKLKFELTYPTGNGDIQIVFTGALKSDGTLAGTMILPQGDPSPWTASRAK
jgi:hypothetical protein